MENTNLTENEIKMLKCIVDSDYHSSNDPTEFVVWFENPFKSKATCSGVCSSLAKKGYASFFDTGCNKDERTMRITKEGYEAFRAVGN